MTRPWDIFLSFAHDDLADARWLARRLEDHGGWQCFVSNDSLDLEVGSAQWSEAIDRVLDRTSVLVLIVTPAALKSRWVLYEWRGFHDDILRGRGGLIVPVCVGGTQPEKLPRALRRYQAVALAVDGERDAAVQRIVHIVRGFLESPSRRSDSPTASAHTVPPVERRPPLGPRVRRRLLALAGAIAFAALGLIGARAYKPRDPRLGLDTIASYARCNDADVARIASVTAWEEAAADFESAMNRWRAPARWRAGYRFARGQRAHLLGQTAQAKDEFQKSIQIEPRWAVLYLGLSGAVVDADPNAALQAAQSARGLDEELWTAVAATALAELRAGQRDRAIEDYRRALALAPASGHLMATLALALRSAGGMYDDEAEELARRSLTLDANMSDPHVLLAERALEKDSPAEALTHAELAASIAPRSVPAQLVLGDALQAVGDLTRAHEAWIAALALGDEVPEQGAPARRLEEVRDAIFRHDVPTCRCRKSDAPKAAPPESPARTGPMTLPHSLGDVRLH